MKFRQSRHFTVMKPFQPGKDHSMIQRYPKSVTISCLISQYDSIMIDCPALREGREELPSNATALNPCPCLAST